MGEQWRANVSYGPPGTKVEYQGILYELVQAHTSQIGWEPAMVPALWRVCRDQSGVKHHRRNSSCSTCSSRSSRRSSYSSYSSNCSCDSCNHNKPKPPHHPPPPHDQHHKPPHEEHHKPPHEEHHKPPHEEHHKPPQEQKHEDHPQPPQDQQKPPQEPQQNMPKPSQEQQQNMPQPHGQGPFGQAPFGFQPPSFGRPPFGNGQGMFGQPPFGQGMPGMYGQPPFGQGMYGQPPFGQQQQYGYNQQTYDWVPYNGFMPQNAIAIPNNLGKTFMIARGDVQGGKHPGYADLDKERCYTSYGGKEVVCDTFEVLVCQPETYTWVPCTDPRNINGNPIIGGYENDGTPLYICKCMRKDVPYFGKTFPTAKCAYYGFNGKEHKIEDFEVLTFLHNSF